MNPLSESSSRSVVIPSKPGPSAYTLDDDDPFIARHNHDPISDLYHPQVTTTVYDAAALATSRVAPQRPQPFPPSHLVVLHIQSIHLHP